MSDGEDTVNSEENLNKTISDYSKYVHGSGMKSLFKVVGIGRDSDVKIAMKARDGLQSVYTWERTPVHYARRLPINKSGVTNIS